MLFESHPSLLCGPRAGYVEFCIASLMVSLLSNTIIKPKITLTTAIINICPIAIDLPPNSIRSWVKIKVEIQDNKVKQINI